jgi:hypothetical protein
MVSVQTRESPKLHGLAWTALEEFLERAMGIEPTALAWEARVLPLYDARAIAILRGLPTLLNNSLATAGIIFGRLLKS